MKMRGQAWLPIYLGVGIKKNISFIIQVETLYSSFLSCKNISDQETAKIFCQLKCNCNIRYCAQFFWWFQCGNTWWNQWSRIWVFSSCELKKWNYKDREIFCTQSVSKKFLKKKMKTKKNIIHPIWFEILWKTQTDTYECIQWNNNIIP